MGFGLKPVPPCNIAESINVTNNSNLTIEAGVRVNFIDHYKLQVEGSLTAQALANDTIHFTAIDTSAGWYGVRFNNLFSTNDSSRFSDCSFQWGKATEINNDANGGAFLIHNFRKVSIKNSRNNNNNNNNNNNTGGAIYSINRSPITSNNQITNNSGGSAILAENSGNYQFYTM
jgi:hypothetical protein